jgi:hypothetical protein
LQAQESEVREYIFRLHRSGPPWGKRADEVDWDANAVGEAVGFSAVLFGQGAWYATGPVVVKAAEALDDAGWTVSTGVGQVPTIVGNVGRRLNQGEEFALPVTGTIVAGILR